MTSNRINFAEISDELLKRYGGAAPRYTSYPTAPEWSNKFGPADYEAAIDAADKKADTPLSIYVHIPFCKKRCLFCGCATHLPQSPQPKDEYDRYVDALAREINTVAQRLRHRRNINQLHWGGGTPTTLSPGQIKRLFGVITNNFSLTADAEISIEVAPAHTTLEQVDVLAGLGFNRISMGVQDTTPKVQQTVGRIQPVEVTRSLFARARANGFDGINIDLMYGLPEQTLENWAENLQTIIDMGPDRLAVFGYAHVPWMRPHQRELPERLLPDASMRLGLYRLAHDKLLDAGYLQIGMDHYARPEDELSIALKERRLWRNFQGYTAGQATSLLGFGATAIGDLAHSFTQNHADLNQYLEAVTSDRLATFRGMVTTIDDQLRRRVITSLMCNLGLVFKEVEADFNIHFWEYFAKEKKNLRQLVDDGLVAFDDEQIKVTSVGRLFVRHVGMVFDNYKSEHTSDGPRFSQTV
jgi:oxygen-independent coproporphyrinogen III oxidase